MLTLAATEARKNIGKLWVLAVEEPVMVEFNGKPKVVVISALEYKRLTGSHPKPRVAGTALPCWRI